MMKMKQWTAAICAAACVLMPLTGCGGQSAAQQDEQTSAEETVDLHELVDITEGEAPLAETNPVLDGVLQPEATGAVVYKNQYAEIDASNASQGYVMVRYIDNETRRIKVQVTRSGGTTYTYNLDADGSYDVFPLSQGDGTYQVNVFRNVSGTSYTQVLGQSVKVTLANQLLPFLYPNQYVNFNQNSTVVSKAATLCADAVDELDKVEKIYKYVVSYINYDYELAATVESTYLPDVDQVLASKKGICFDYASLMSAMLRAEGIPAKLVVGYTSRGEYHAWISVHISEVGWIDNIISFNGEQWKLMDPTFASTGKSSQKVLDYINDPANYTEKYCY